MAIKERDKPSKKKIKPLLPSLEDTIPQWGVESKGGRLHIDEPFVIDLDAPWIIDVENNPDGTLAGYGVTQNGVDVYFYTDFAFGSEVVFKHCKFIGHNVKYDVQMLRKWGFDVSPDQIVFDTQLASYVQDSTRFRHGLKPLAKDLLGLEWPTYKEVCGTGKKAVSLSQVRPIVVANYNGCDVLATYRLYKYFTERLTAAQTEYLNTIEMPTMRVLLEMEERGVQIDLARVDLLKATLESEQGDLHNIICESLYIANPNSNAQVGKALASFGLDLPRTEKGAISVGADALKPHKDHPLVSPLIRYNEISTLVSNFLRPISEKTKANGRLYGSFNQAITDTGRLSSSGPNLQNIPTRTVDGNKIRECFVAAPGRVLIDADYSQIEPRLMAHFSQDPELFRVFQEGEDLYEVIAAKVGCDRQVAKVLWLALSYNAGSYRISQIAGISRYKAQDFLDAMRRAFSQLFYWKDKVTQKAEIDGGVTTMFGRFIPLTDNAAHLSVNYTVQGSAAEIMKLAIQETKDFRPVLTVHDELVFELQDAADLPIDEIKQRLESVAELSVPLKVEIKQGTTWAEAKGK